MNKLIIENESEFDFSALADALYKELKQKAKLKAELVFVTDAEIKELNKNTRNIDSVTDVLSYPSIDKIKGVILNKKDYPFDIDEEGNIFIGSIAICKEVAVNQAKEFNHSLEREIFYLTVHGLLHLLGYDHITAEEKEEMRITEEKIMEKINLTREQE